MGRHKLFERDDVIDKALHVFWEKGYSNTSMKDLEDATGVFKPALYSEFSDKEGLFFECLKYYRKNYAARLSLLKEPAGWENIEIFLKSVLPDKSGKGCFEVSANTRDLPFLSEKIKSSDAYAEQILKDIQKNLKAAGEGKRAELLSGIIFTFYCGISALATHQSRKKLEQRVMDFLKFLMNQ